MTFSKLKKLVVASAAALAVGTAAFAQTTLVIGTGAELSHLDPRVATDVPSVERLNPIMEPLGSFDFVRGLAPRLATGWEFSDDRLTLPFQLRAGVKFHNAADSTRQD